MRLRFGLALTGSVLLLSLAAPAFAAPHLAASTTTAEPSARPTGEGPRAIVTTSDNGQTRVYTARVLTANGDAVRGATLDISGLSDDPDVRIPTQAMKPMPTDPTRYTASMTYPVSGEWVLTIRVHQPQSFVHLVIESVSASAAPAPSHRDTPSRAALRRLAPDFSAKYDPTTGVGATGQWTAADAALATARATQSGGASHGGIADAAIPTHVGETVGSRITNTFVAGAHAFGALAWFVGMLGLALANRRQGTRLASELCALVQDRYTLLVGGGLLIVIMTGLINMQNATPTGWDLGALLATGTGQAYFVVLGLKLALAAMSIVVSIQIGQLLRHPLARATSLSLRSAGAAANTPASITRALRLGYLNATFGAAILVCVEILNQLHFSVHGF